MSTMLKGNFSASKQFVGLVSRHRQLIWEMTRREISDRYAGQVFGMLWAIGHPLFLIGLYIFIFAFVFKTRLGGTVEMPRDYTTYMLSGLVAWIGFQESMVKACTVITSNTSLVKQVAFPFEILPLKSVLSSLLVPVVAVVLLTIYVAARTAALPWTYALIPVVFAMQVLSMLGIAYFLAAVGVYFRDAKDFIQLFATAGVYLIPAFYLPAWVPDLVKPVLYLNPFSYPIWCYQDVLYFGTFAHPWAWLVTPVLSVGGFLIGYRVFRRLKLGFGSML